MLLSAESAICIDYPATITLEGDASSL